MNSTNGIDVKLEPGDGRGRVKVIFENRDTRPRAIDRRMACMMGFVPNAAFLFRTRTRFVGPRITCFGDDPSFYQVLAPGESTSVDVDLTVFEGPKGECEVMYEAIHRDPSTSEIYTLRSPPASIRFS